MEIIETIIKIKPQFIKKPPRYLNKNHFICFDIVTFIIKDIKCVVMISIVLLNSANL